MEPLGGRDKEKETVLLSWHSPDYTDYVRDWKWFSLFAVCFLLLVSYTIYVQDWFMLGIFVILAGFIYWYQAKTPGISSFRITQLGVYLNDRFYAYSEIHSFWLVVDKEPKKLNVIFNKAYLPQLTILIQTVDPVTVRTTLSKFIPEQVGREESLIDKLSRWLKI